MNTSHIAVFVCLGIFITGCIGIPSRPSCPDGSPLVNCFMDPCSGAICYNPPNLTCRANYCGGCNREWYNRFGVKARCYRDELQGEY
ncbi:hypothetical protein DPMN_101925 [Dreissena polymorpha]|uniref:Uncharacterized protein n=1 Tax=Dreissena polymorpha TaxID=45954 RepID=A0A9D4LK74_DREPO|nr:hypothetical protein DPMN_101925 [Dreissena polymorpha]